jgi:hypothetical protein
VTFSISIRNPRHGWCDVELCLGEHRFEWAVSDVANDPVQQLADLGLFAAGHDLGRTSVTFWLEPAGYSLEAVRDPEWRLSLQYSKHAFARLFDPTFVAEQSIDPRTCAVEILRCLRAARSELIAASSRSYKFPDALLSQLEASLA